MLGVVQQGTDDDPVVSAHGGGAVRTAGGVLMKGVGPPDVLAGTMDFSIVAGPDVETVPDTSGSVFQELAGNAFDVVAVPGAVLGEGFQGFPVVGPFQSDEGLGDGVFLNI